MASTVLLQTWTTRAGAVEEEGRLAGRRGPPSYRTLGVPHSGELEDHCCQLLVCHDGKRRRFRRHLQRGSERR
jgi:hypothetical protein